MSLAQKIKKSSKVAPHIIVEALAGTGKTTTLIEGLKHLRGEKTSITPSPQQKAVWDAMCDGYEPASINFVAFNKQIAAELSRRVPRGCNAMTMHSMGFQAVKNSFTLMKGFNAVNGWRVSNIIEEITGKNLWHLKKNESEFLQGLDKLVGLCKVNLCDGTDYQELDQLVSHYDITMGKHKPQIFELVNQVLERCKDVAKDQYIDFNDMVWLPVVLELACEKYDLLLWDEAQDGNRCQQALAMKCGKRLLLCGDRNQAIYGFAGADSKAMDRMRDELSETKESCVVLPLTVTRRCGKTIVEHIQRLVPTFEAHETNGEGKVREMNMSTTNVGAEDYVDYRDHVTDGDMIICRVNAPLVSECFRFLRRGKKANIQGRDIGTNLINVVKKSMKNEARTSGVVSAKDWEEYFKTLSTADAIINLSNWCHTEVKNEMSKRNSSDVVVANIQDKFDCLMFFCEGKKFISDMVAEIEKIFTDNKTDGVLLSSIHKSKGLEADNVFFLQPTGGTCPHPSAKQSWEIEQEYNLLYVGESRAIKTLTIVRP